MDITSFLGVSRGLTLIVLYPTFTIRSARRDNNQNCLGQNMKVFPILLSKYPKFESQFIFTKVKIVQVVTPGKRGKTFITQLYFRGLIPPRYENYVRYRRSQFGFVLTVNEYGNLPNGGRILIFSITLDE